MKFKIDEYKKKIKAIKYILKYDSFDLVTVLSPQDEFKVILGNELNATLKPKNIRDEHILKNIVDKVCSKIFKRKSKEMISSDVILSQSMWLYSAVAGYASVWELNVKLLASRYGVDIKRLHNDKSKKERKSNITVYRNLKDIINDFQDNTNKCFSLDLQNIGNLRSSLVHGNFDQLRILFNNCSKKIKDSHKGNVLSFDISSPESQPLNLSDNIEQKIKEKEDVFGWFLEGTNSNLLDEIRQHFDESIDKINILADFKMISFGKRGNTFKKLIYEEGSINKSDIKLYQEHFDSTQEKYDARKYFEELNELFVRDIIK